MSAWIRALPFAISVLVATPALAQTATPPDAAAEKPKAPFTEGPYMSADGTYLIEVKWTGEAIEVIEPNRTSQYTRQGDGTFVHVSQTTQIRYGIRILDATTLEAFKPGTNNPPTRLLLRKDATELAEKDTSAVLALVMKYTGLAQTDPDNAHVWAACGAAAMAKMQLTEQGFAEYAVTAAATLKPIMVNAATTPCEDAIPAAFWSKAP